MRKGTGKSRFLEFHISYLLVSIGFILTGNYLSLIAFTFLVLIHEFGHAIMAFFLNVDIKKIIIYPFGGMTKLDGLVNLSIIKELLIAVSGVAMQMFGYLFIYFLWKIHLIRGYTLELFTFYHMSIIFFNLLPIYPLDGGKIIQLLLQIVFPFRVSNIISIISSFIFSFIFFSFYSISYSNIVIYFIILWYLVDFYFKRDYIYIRFLLERYLYNFNFNRIKIIRDYRYMYKDRIHFIYIGKVLVAEKEFLRKYFDKKNLYFKILIYFFVFFWYT